MLVARLALLNPELALVERGLVALQSALGGGGHQVLSNKLRFQMGSQLNTSPERSKSKKLDLSAGMAWSSTVCGVQPSLR